MDQASDSLRVWNMTTEAGGSVSYWLTQLKNGDSSADQLIWERYYAQLVRLAKRKLPNVSGGDEEDVALSAFHSFLVGARRGHFPRLDDRDDLWRILVFITARKASNQRRNDNAIKRGGDFNQTVSTDLDQIVGREPSPEFAAMVTDEFRWLLDLLEDETLRKIAILKLEGCNNLEIRDQVGCALRTVVNKLTLIRKTWMDSLPDDAE